MTSALVRRSLAFALTLLGLFDSLYLLWVYASPTHAMVCLGSGCDEVRASRFAHFLGLPTPLYGVVMYGVLALLIFAEPLLSADAGSWLRRAIAVIAAAGVVASAALTAIEAWVLHAWCAWCVVQAVAIVVIFILSLSLLRAPAFPDRAAGWRHALVLLLAIAAAAPTFTWLMRHADQAVQAAPPSATDLAQRLVRPDSHATGNPEARVVLVEFADMQCPSCVAAHPEMRELRRVYGNRVRFVFRQFPLEQAHPYSLHAAQASECAAQQGRFWEAVDRFYGANGDLSDSSLERYAGELGLDSARFRACLGSNATLAAVRRDRDDGLVLGVRATPTFFLGNQRIVGAPELARFQQLLNAELSLYGSVSASTENTAGNPRAPHAGAGVTAGGNSSAGNSGGTSGFLSIQGNSTDCSLDAPKGPEPPMIHTAEAEKLFHGGSVFVDVRSSNEFHQARIAGAMNLPLLEAGRRATELPRDRTIVLYEGGGGGSADVCAASRSVGRVLLGHGYQKVVVYQDGLTGWQKQSLPVDR